MREYAYDHDHSVVINRQHTEIDKRKSRGVDTDAEHFDNRLDKVDHHSPVSVRLRRVTVIYASRVVNHKHDVRITRCTNGDVIYFFFNFITALT